MKKTIEVLRTVLAEDLVSRFSFPTDAQVLETWYWKGYNTYSKQIAEVGVAVFCANDSLLEVEIKDLSNLSIGQNFCYLPEKSSELDIFRTLCPILGFDVDSMESLSTEGLYIWDKVSCNKVAQGKYSEVKNTYSDKFGDVAINSIASSNEYAITAWFGGMALYKIILL